jgi:hypothetical protein
MNIFVLDRNPETAAQLQCDKHVIKMILETAQLLCSPFEPGTALYKRTHYNHPSAIWTRISEANYEWLLQHGLALCEEYRYRWDKERDHASLRVIDWCSNHYKALGLPNVGLTEFPQAMPEEFRRSDVVQTYREYYKCGKKHLLKWKKEKRTSVDS